MFEEDWHAIPEETTGQIAKVKGPALAIAAKLEKIQAAEQMRLRSLRAQRNETGAALSKGRIDAYRSARKLLVSSSGSVEALNAIPGLLVQLAEEARRQARFSLFKKRVDLRTKSATYAKLARFVRQEAAVLASQTKNSPSRTSASKTSRSRTSHLSKQSYR